MPVDLSEFTSAVPTKCKFGRRLDEMSDEQTAKATEAASADSKTITHERVAKVVTDWGFPVSSDVVRKHRKGECSCG